MRILFNNILKTQTVTASSENGNYPVDNLFADQTRKVYRSTDPSVTINITGAGALIDHLYMSGLNLTGNAVVTLEGNDTDVWTAPDFSQAVQVRTGGYVFHSFDSAQYNYWRVVIIDAANPAGYIEIAALWLSGSLQMPGMSLNQEVPQITTTEISQTESGEAYVNVGYEYRQGVVSFPYISNSERDAIKAFWQANQYRPVIIAIWAESLDVEPPFYAMIPEAPAWRRSDDMALLWSLSMTFREVF